LGKKFSGIKSTKSKVTKIAEAKIKKISLMSGYIVFKIALFFLFKVGKSTNEKEDRRFEKIAKIL
jgi:hypothetical protein